MLFGWVVIVIGGIAAMCFLAYLVFLRYVIDKTGTTEGLSHVAEAIKAYRVPLPSYKSHKTKSEL